MITTVDRLPQFSTDRFQSHPDFVYVKDDEPHRVNTNPRYKFFRQQHFTAGDYEQFFEHWDASNPTMDMDASNPTMNRDLRSTSKTILHPHVQDPLYEHLQVGEVYRTFEYIFHKFKKGIFVKFSDGNPTVFLPFSKVDYTNEWYSTITVNPSHYESLLDMMKYIAGMEKREFQESRIHKDVRSWYGNNGLVRLEYPTSESDNGVNRMHDMFLTLARERIVPHCEFFINKRDFPILKKDGTEAYEVFFGPACTLTRPLHRVAPILSMTTTTDHADIPIPTWEDWARVSYWYDERLFGKEFRTFPRGEDFDQIPWHTKKPTAVFRGQSTGLGTTVETNPRLFFSMLSAQHRCDPTDGYPYLDAGITKWNLRPRKHVHTAFLETIRITELSFGLVASLSPLEQAEYKYILHLPGHSEAYRLSLELYSGSVILMYPCRYQLWYSHRLQPWVHYVPLDSELSLDIYEKIEWCKAHDAQCQQIVKNARVFAETYLSRDAMLDYLQDTLWALWSSSWKTMRHMPFTITEMMYHHESERYRQLVHTYLEEARDLWSLYEVVDIWNHLSNECFGSFDPIVCGFLLTALCHEGYPLVKDIIPSFSKSTPKIHQKGLTGIQGPTTFPPRGKVYVKGRCLFQKALPCQSPQRYHEILLSFLALNAMAIKSPHFVYAYTLYEPLPNDPHESYAYLLTDYCEGVNLDECIIQQMCTLPQLMSLWMQICLALMEAQREIGFLHMDLYPWNIIIKTEKTSLTYIVNEGTRIHVMAPQIPVFVDYGRSHIVSESHHYYFVSPFHPSMIQDVISILWSSLHLYLSHRKLEGWEMRIILRLMRFFSGTPYLPSESVVSIGALKRYLREKKKFSNMLHDQKSGLDHLSPMDVYYHIRNIWSTLDKTWTDGWTFVEQKITPSMVWQMYNSSTYLNPLLSYPYIRDMVPNAIRLLLHPLVVELQKQDLVPPTVWTTSLDECTGEMQASISTMEQFQRWRVRTYVRCCDDDDDAGQMVSSWLPYWFDRILRECQRIRMLSSSLNTTTTILPVLMSHPFEMMEICADETTKTTMLTWTEVHALSQFSLGLTSKDIMTLWMSCFQRCTLETWMTDHKRFLSKK